MRSFFITLVLCLLSAATVVGPYLMLDVPGGSPEGNMAIAWLSLGLWLLTGLVVTATAGITLLVAVFSQRNLRSWIASTQAIFGSFAAATCFLAVGEPTAGYAFGLYTLLMLAAVAHNAGGGPAN